MGTSCIIRNFQNKTVEMKQIIFLLSAFLILGCSKKELIISTSDDKPEFVLNRIQCNFNVYTTIDSSAKDTIVATEMLYGLDGYFHLQYGAITKQIVSFNGYVDTIYGSNVEGIPDKRNLPVWMTKYTVPNILGKLDSTKIVVKIYGSFYSDNTYQNRTADFYRQDSSYIRISRWVFILP